MLGFYCTNMDPGPEGKQAAWCGTIFTNLFPNYFYGKSSTIEIGHRRVLSSRI
jgi:hypothetical protein